MLASLFCAAFERMLQQQQEEELVASGVEEELSLVRSSRKFSGAAKYRTRFNVLWKREFPFIAAVKGDPFK